MKETGIVRKLDHLGRVCLPKELRRKLHIGEEDPIEIYVDKDCVILKKYDAIGDADKLLDNLEKSIRLCDTMIPTKKMHRLLDKVKEMRQILKEA